jgi:hypothetical protein
MSQFQEKKRRDILRPSFQTSLYFLENEDDIFKTLFVSNISSLNVRVFKYIFLYFIKHKTLGLGSHF